MSTTKTHITARSIVDEVLGRRMTRELWTANYAKALPVSVQDFDLSAVLPAVFYMFRFGHRRGKGKFLEVFGNDAVTAKELKRAATIERVADRLIETAAFDGFGDDTTRAILGDLLLCFCLENSKRALGRHEQVQRVAPAHYMASWIDLPEKVADLRYVPEMIVAMLANQEGPSVQANQQNERSWFAVGRGFEDNVLLKAFHQGVIRKGQLADRTADHFQEDIAVGLDQLLMVRLAQQLGESPDKLRGGEGERISNQRPVAEQAAQHFSEDIRRIVRAYAGVIPRHAFVELLESCMAVGLATIATSVIELLFGWSETGEISKQYDQRPTQLFVDCSNGVERTLRTLAEQSMEDFTRRIERFPIVLMALRLLDYSAHYDPKLKKVSIQTWPFATEWINLLGKLLYQQTEEARPILYEMERKSEELAERLQDDYPEAAAMMRNEQAQPNPVWRLAEALTFLQGRKNTQNNVVALLDSAFMIGRPNGLAVRRAVIRKTSAGGLGKKRDLRSLVFTDSVLDYLVHLHVLRAGNKSGYRTLSLKDFLYLLRERYGLCIDQAPSGLVISNEVLQQNRLVLERRLRDLGLLVGVNDAESMKRLMPRYHHVEEQDNGVD